MMSEKKDSILIIFLASRFKIQELEGCIIITQITAHIPTHIPNFKHLAAFE